MLALPRRVHRSAVCHLIACYCPRGVSGRVRPRSLPAPRGLTLTLMDVRLKGKALELRSLEVMARLSAVDPPSIVELAAEYGVTELTVYRWRNRGAAMLMPPAEELDTWRDELLGALMRQLMVADRGGDTAGVVRVADRISKMLGLDFGDRTAERMARVEETKVALIVSAIQGALDSLDISAADRAAAIEAVATQLDAKAASV